MKKNSIIVKKLFVTLTVQENHSFLVFTAANHSILGICYDSLNSVNTMKFIWDKSNKRLLFPQSPIVDNSRNWWFSVPNYLPTGLVKLQRSSSLLLKYLVMWIHRVEWFKRCVNQMFWSTYSKYKPVLTGTCTAHVTSDTVNIYSPRFP